MTWRRVRPSCSFLDWWAISRIPSEILSNFSGVILFSAALTLRCTIAGSMWPGVATAAAAAEGRPMLGGFQPDEEVVIGLRSIPAVRGMVLAAWASLPF